MMVRAFVVSAAVALCTPATGTSADPGPKETRSKPGTAKMAALLKKIADTTDPLQNVYYNNRRAALIREQRARATQPVEQLRLEMSLGYEVLAAGNPVEAMSHFDVVMRALTAPGVRAAPSSLRQLHEFMTLANLRLGEQQNCLSRHGPDSCLMPIRGSGVHAVPDGSRKAIEHLNKLLEAEPANLSYRWLLNLAYMTLGEHPQRVPPRLLIPQEVFDSDQPFPRFADVAHGAVVENTGMAGGAILEDFDRDGFIDLVNSGWGAYDQIKFFRNNADGTFADRTVEAGLIGETGGLNIIQVDYNNDGWPDIFVLRGAWMREAGNIPNSLLRNNGDGRFEDVTETAGLLSFHPTQAAAWGDYDNDGWIDVFIGNESTTGVPHACELYRNNHDGTFTNIAEQAGVAFLRFVKGVDCGDYNNDGLPDLYLSCLGQANVLLRNEGRCRSESGHEAPCRFTDVTARAGVSEPSSSFPTWFFDYDNDGWEDILCASFGSFSASSEGDVAADYLGLPTSAERPRLFHNNHDGTFTDATRAAHFDTVLVAMGANFGDLDNDGWLDMFFGTGQPSLSSLIPNRVFRNVDGQYFNDVTTAGGFGHLQKGHAIAFGDVDNDGDQDVFADLGGAYEGDVFQNALYENPGFPEHHWVTLRLEGVQSNRAGIGARVRVTVETAQGRRDVFVNAGTGGSFGSSTLQQEVGLGRAMAIKQIDVRWPTSKTTQVFRDVVMDQAYTVREGESSLAPVVLRRFKLGGANPATATAPCH